MPSDHTCIQHGRPIVLRSYESERTPDTICTQSAHNLHGLHTHHQPVRLYCLCMELPKTGFMICAAKADWTGP